MEKITEKKKSGAALLAIGLVILAGLIIVWLLSTGVKQASIEQKESVEEFYAPYWINDSTMHMNVSESACILFQIEGDYCYLKTNGIDYTVLDGDTLKVTYHEGKNLVTKPIRLDTIENLEYEDLYVCLEFLL